MSANFTFLALVDFDLNLDVDLDVGSFVLDSISRTTLR